MNGTPELKAIDPAALASLTTGILMVEFPRMHEAAEWLCGHPVWTHELPMMAERLKTIARTQFPELPTEIGTDWQSARDAVRIHYGDSVDVARGCETRPADDALEWHVAAGLSFASCIAAAANNPDIWWSGRGPR